MKPLYARVQAERGGLEGVLHFQGCIGWTTEKRHAAVRKLFPRAHVSKSRNAMAAWNYCGKKETAVEGPYEIGVPPASKAVKGDTKQRNQMILEKGVVEAVNEGLIPIEKFK